MENRGLAPINWMHHISKIIEGKTESYRVRVCRTCTKLSAPLELGSYADVESALLINDAYEILQGRVKQLHLLVPDDINYLKYLNVRKRGGLQDVPLLMALEERTKKSYLKSKGSTETDETPPLPPNGSEPSSGSGKSHPIANSSSSSSSSKQRGIVDEVDDFNDRRAGFEPQISLMENVIPRGHMHSGPAPFSMPFMIHPSSLPSAFLPVGYPMQQVSSTQMFHPMAGPSTELQPKNPLDFLSEVAGYQSYQPTMPLSSSSRQQYEMPTVDFPGQGYPSNETFSNRSTTASTNHNGSLLHNSQDRKQFASYSEKAQAFKNSEVYQQSIIGSTANGHSNGHAETLSSADDVNDSRGSDSSATSLPIKKRIRSYDLMFSNHEKVACDSHSITEILKTSIKPYSQHLLMWHYFDDERSADVMLDHLINFLSVEVLNPHNHKKYVSPSSLPFYPSRSLQGASENVNGEDPLQNDPEGSRNQLIKTMESSYCLPSAEILKIISSVLQTNNEDTQAMVFKVSKILPHDSPSIADYTATYHVASSVLNSLEDFEHSISLDESPETTKQMLDKKMELVDMFIRYMHTVAAQFDYILRLTIWNSQDIEILDAEIKVNGIFNQLSMYLGVAVKFIKDLLRVISSLQPTPSSSTGGESPDTHSMKEDDSTESTVEEISTEPKSIEELKSYLLKKLTSSSQHAVNGLSLMMTTFCTSSLAVKSICSDDSAIYRCVVVCQECYPILCLHIKDIKILISYTFQFAHIMSSLLFTLTEDVAHPVFVDEPSKIASLNGGASQNKEEEAAKFKELAFSLGADLIGLIQKYAQAFPSGKTDGMKSLFYHEIGLCAHISIFQLSITLMDQNFLSSFGYTMRELLERVNGIMMSIMDICEEYTCTTTSTHLLVAVYKLAKSCLFHTHRLVNETEYVSGVVQSCKRMLHLVSSRYVLAKILHEKIISIEESELKGK